MRARCPAHMIEFYFIALTILRITCKAIDSSASFEWCHIYRQTDRQWLTQGQEVDVSKVHRSHNLTNIHQ